MQPNEIQVSAEDNVLTIRVARTYAEETKQDDRYLRRERYAGASTRTLALPTSIDADTVAASYERGVLTVRVPKGTAASTKSIPIQAQEPSSPH
jgi:HSP20 family protein